jgi:hypothetical protein
MCKGNKRRQWRPQIRAESTGLPQIRKGKAVEGGVEILRREVGERCVRGGVKPG